MKGRAIYFFVAGLISLIGPTADSVAQVPLSNRCFTPTFWCFMQVVAPVNYPCFCATPYGPVGGIVR